MGTRAGKRQARPSRRGEGTGLSRWSDILGFGGKGRDERVSADDARKAARIRETMRWRGYDLTAYTDAEIVAVSDRLGGGVSETGETTEASREALAAALREMRSSGEVIELPARMAPHEPESEAARPLESVQAEPEPPSPEAIDPAPASVHAPPPIRPAPAVSGEDARTFLVRMRHVFGIHSWRPMPGRDDTYLWCPGCGQERGLPAAARPLSFGREDLQDAGPAAETNHQPEPEVEDEWRIPPSAPRSQQQEVLPGLSRWLIRSPWWMKMLAIFALVQVAGLIASVVRSL